MRLLTTGHKTAQDSDRAMQTYLLDFIIAPGEPPSEQLHFTTNYHTIEYNGIEWVGLGKTLSLQLPEEDASMEAHACEVVLDGQDPAMLSLALNEDLEGLDFSIWVVQFDPDTRVAIGVAWLYHSGTVSEVRVGPPIQGGK